MVHYQHQQMCGRCHSNQHQAQQRRVLEREAQARLFLCEFQRPGAGLLSAHFREPAQIDQGQFDCDLRHDPLQRLALITQKLGAQGFVSGN